MNNTNDNRDQKLNDQTTGIADDTTVSEDQASVPSKNDRNEERLM